MRFRVVWLSLFLVLSLFLILANLPMDAQLHMRETSPETFAHVVKLVDRVAPTVVLTDSSRMAQVAVSARLQGRVLTSSLQGPSGRSLGWVNDTLIASGKIQEHFNAFGGEDRVWIAPEGGQFSVFFAPNAPFDMTHWYTPAAVDTKPFEQVGKTKSSVSFRKRFALENHSGTKFKIQLDRTVRLVPEKEVWNALGIPSAAGVQMVAFESRNKLTNIGTKKWSRKTGLLSLWVLGQFQASPSTTIVIPIHTGSTEKLGVPVTSDYFGKIPPERLRLESNAVFMKADADYRGKLGVNPKRTKGLLASYDAEHHILTIVQELPAPNPLAAYVNNAWKIQNKPFSGDAVNAYNDGPQAGGERLGHFYELETLSSAQALGPGQSIEHTQRTIHIEGDEQKLNGISKSVLGVTLDEIRNAFQNRVKES